MTSYFSGTNAKARPSAAATSVVALRTFGPSTQFFDGMLARVLGVSSFEYSTASVAADNGTTVIKPADAGGTGRWLALAGGGGAQGAQGAAGAAGAQGAQGAEATTVISPTSIASQQNDYTPTGWSSARYVLINPTANCVITGFSSTATILRKTLVNVGTGDFDITIANDSFASTAANRIKARVPNDAYLLQDRSLEIWYDVSVSRWRIL